MQLILLSGGSGKRLWPLSNDSYSKQFLRLLPTADGDVVCIHKGHKHAVKAVTDLHFVEVQMGDRLIEEDIERFDFDWE